jgi:CubicO group peptidase (beta-lactamase class C family)
MSLFSQLARLGIATVLIGSPALAATAKAPQPTIAEIDRAAVTFISDGNAPGVSVAVVKGGHLLFAKAYGMENLETASRATVDTVFRAGSITKQFVAAAVLQLAQNKSLSIDDQVSKYIPELAEAKGLTLRMLLNQTSGLHDYTETPEFGAQMVQRHTQKEMIDYIASMKPLLDFAPGTKWAYSNTNYYVLGAVVERVSGKSLGQYLQANVIAPAELKSTAVDDESDVVPHRASGYTRIKGQPGHYRNAQFVSMDNAGGAGALRTTAVDLATWQQALFAGRIVDAASLSAMTSPGRLSSGEVAVRPDAPITLGTPNYGFGLELGALDGERAIGHGGSVPGFTAYLVTFPRQDMTIAIMANGAPVDADGIRVIERAAFRIARY